jgi:hypothetical protein
VNTRILSCAAILTPLLCTLPVPARAQETSEPAPVTREPVDYSKPVSRREIETYRTLSTRLGAWVFTPGLELQELYESNVYATETDVESDFVTLLKPRARLQSDWSVHSILLETGADLGWYKDLTDENYQDWYALNDNSFEIRRGLDLTTNLLYRNAHVPRSSPDSLDASEEPLTYDLLSGTLGLERALGKLGVRLDVKAESIQYDDSRSRLTGRPIDNSDRNYDSLLGGIQVSYRPQPEAEAYLGARLRDIRYEDSTINGGPNRDNQGYEFKLGARKGFSDLWFLDAYLGYAPSFYDDDSLEDITGDPALILGTNLLWNPTALTSIIADLSRATYQTTESGASAIVSTGLSLRLEHKFTQSMLLDARLGYSQADYYGSEREDDNYRAGVGAQYFFTRLVAVRAAYDYSERDSSQLGSSYDNHSASLQLRLNY